MKWTKQQKIGVGVLSLAAIAFGVDRFFVQGRNDDVAPAAIVSAPELPRSTPAETSIKVVLAQAAQPMAVLARRLNEVAQAEGMESGRTRDAMTPPTSWYRNASKAAPKVAVNGAADFNAKYRVSAVMRTGPGSQQGLAVIAGETVRVGQVFNGYTLKSIHDRSITLSDGREDFVVELPASGLASVR